MVHKKIKSLILIRHAKSTWDLKTSSDFDRPLNSEGINDAKLMGNILLNKINKLDIILSSPANRAIHTAKIIKSQLKLSIDIKQREEIYRASYTDLISMIAKLNNKISSIALIGHNPTIHILLEKLSGKIFIKFPTCSIAQINFSSNSWVDIDMGILEYFISPASIN